MEVEVDPALTDELIGPPVPEELDEASDEDEDVGLGGFGDVQLVGSPILQPLPQSAE